MLLKSFNNWVLNIMSRKLLWGHIQNMILEIPAILRVLIGTFMSNKKKKKKDFLVSNWLIVVSYKNWFILYFFIPSITIMKLSF